MLALSLSWNANKFKDIKRQINEVIEAGFRQVELNFSLTEKEVIQIDNFRKKGELEVISCHNFCPIPKGLSVKKALPDYYSLSSTNERKRRLALKYSKNSIDTVSRLGAKVLVLHSGKVDMPDASKQLMRLYAQGKKNSATFKYIAGSMRKQREKRKQPYLDKAVASIEELSAYAKKSGVRIALENRVYYSEIPQFDEFEIFLKRTGAFFWFDTGHAFIMEKLWKVKALPYLERYSDRLIGFHLHDCIGMQDHLAPGTGKFNFSKLRPFIKHSILKVIEAHSPATTEELVRSIAFLNKALN